MRLEITEQIDRLKDCPILRSPSLGIENSVKGIQISSGTVLTKKRQVELCLINKGASTKRRLSAELFQYQLLNWVIEQSLTRPNARLARVTRTPGKTDAGSKCLVIGLGHARRNAGVTRNDQSHRILRGTVGIGTSTRKDRRILARTESLDVLCNIRQRRVQLPSQPIVQRDVWLYLPTVLRI